VRAKWTDALARLCSRLVGILGLRVECTRTLLYARLASIEASVRVRFAAGDVVLALAAAPYVFALSTSRPVIFVSDATFASISAIYPSFADMPRWLRRSANRVEHDALHNSDRLLYCSEWAKLSAIADYGVAPAAIDVMPLGPNISAAVIGEYATLKSADFSAGVRLLFIGADWERKGGPMMLDLQRQIRLRGVPCELYLVGNCPAELASRDGVHALGRLDKTDPMQLRELCRLYESCHFFVLPTSGEAFGVVFSEAQAFGCPSLTYAVGGTPTAVQDGVTGFTLPQSASAAQFADVICTLIHDPARYQEMSARCRARYQNEANWAIWARTVAALAGRLTRTPHNQRHS
jgi:glycosyltransferase involved in cell wall biosynthesis